MYLILWTRDDRCYSVERFATKWWSCSFYKSKGRCFRGFNGPEDEIFFFSALMQFISDDVYLAVLTPQDLVGMRLGCSKRLASDEENIVRFIWTRLSFQTYSEKSWGLPEFCVAFSQLATSQRKKAVRLDLAIAQLADCQLKLCGIACKWVIAFISQKIQYPLQHYVCGWYIACWQAQGIGPPVFWISNACICKEWRKWMSPWN